MIRTKFLLVLSIFCALATGAQTDAPPPTVHTVREPGMTPPRLLKSVEARLSDEAAQCEYDGTVTLWGVVGVNGKVTDLKVARSLGAGLDEQAMAAVGHWVFDPGTKDGKPVPVAVNLDVKFEIPHRTKITKLMQLSDAGDAIAQLRLSTAYYMGTGISRDPKLGEYWLMKAANQNQKYALCELGDAAFNKRDLASAYAWYSLALDHGCDRGGLQLERVKSQIATEEINLAIQRINDWNRLHGQLSTNK